uniref:ORF 2; putative n=1 Tax=Trypanosoma brucei TaxID=5691 RepID=Q26741_9TRYP|nr:ORF 2; putative [Trypanosoma brucei]
MVHTTERRIKNTRNNKDNITTKKSSHWYRECRQVLDFTRDQVNTK